MRISPIFPLWLAIIITIIFFLFFLRQEKKKNKNLIFIFILLFMINLRIQIPSDDVTTVTNNLDVLFVIDTTLSMRAEDGRNKLTRMEMVKEDTEYIIDRLNGARFALLQFDNTARLTIPFIKDTNLIYETIQNLHTIDYTYGRGSTLGVPIETMENTLSAASKKEGRLQIVFFISDGEQTATTELESFAKLKQYIDGGAVLGYGTKSGGPMAEYNYEGTIYYVNDFTSDGRYDKVYSKLDEANLQTIAKDMGVSYIHMTKTKDIENVIQKIQKLKETADDESDTGYDDLYYLFGIPLFILILLELRKL